MSLSGGRFNAATRELQQSRDNFTFMRFIDEHTRDERKTSGVKEEARAIARLVKSLGKAERTDDDACTVCVRVQWTGSYKISRTLFIACALRARDVIRNKYV